MSEITIKRPSDFHAHLREGEMLRKVLPLHNYYKYITVMGNLQTPIATAYDVKKYRQEIQALNPKFRPIMSLMLTKTTTSATIKAATDVGARVLKFIPSNTSTNSGDGITLDDLKLFHSSIEQMAKRDMVFSGHWELIQNPKTGNFIPEEEREKRAIPYLEELIKACPSVKVVVEHISTKEMVDFVKSAPDNVSATLTLHHALLSRKNLIRKGKINPFYYCKPILKKEHDRQAVLEAMLSGNQKFFFGSDSAPHPLEKKLEGAAGIYIPAYIAIPLLCQVFSDTGTSPENLEKFASLNGPKVYGLTPPTEHITLVEEGWVVKEWPDIPTPLMVRKTMGWKIKSTTY